MNASRGHESYYSDYVEIDPTGRYGRHHEILGKGSSKTVYRAFDEYEGIEVAWNQVKLTDFLQRPGDLERLYSEIHLLKTLKHKNIMKFYTSWVDVANRNINFVTEMFTSGTLRQYRLKHKKVNIRAVKNWCRQILEGLLYLHNHNPPVIHRDLKCDNIFINGNQGEVKIGDLGLAAILRKSYAAHCVGTPEFMAPEVYAEEYNELVDIYSFGMCVLEMVTFEYPYSECTHPAQIYKKVVTGKKPDALYKVKDPEVRQFVEKCLATVSCRLPASELLKDPFLQLDDEGYEVPFCHSNDYYTSLGCSYPDDIGYEPDLDLGVSDFDLFTSPDDECSTEMDISIKGRKRGDGDVFLRLRMADKEGRVRNIYFPFDIENDTALSVATEMVSELDISDQDVTKIAEMIDGEISSLVPTWKRGSSLDEPLECSSINADCCSSEYLSDYVSSDNPRAQNLQVLHCSKNSSPGTHGRFEEITYQVEGNDQDKTASASSSSQCDGIRFTDIMAQHDAPDSRLIRSLSVPSYRGFDQMDVGDHQIPVTPNNSPASTVKDSHENEIRKELRWLKTKYQMQLNEIRDHQLGLQLRPPISTRRRAGVKKDKLESQQSRNGSYKQEQLDTAKSLPTEGIFPHSLQRTTSLPVDVADS